MTEKITVILSDIIRYDLYGVSMHRYMVYIAGVLGVSPNKSAFCLTKGVSCASTPERV